MELEIDIGSSSLDEKTLGSGFGGALHKQKDLEYQRL
jgi:hypothetical protein